MSKIVKSIIRFFAWGLSGLLLLFLLIVIALNIPKIQAYVASSIINYLQENTKHKIELAGVSIRWLDHGVFTQFRLYDFENNLMLSADEILVDFELMSLFRENTIKIDGIELTNPQLNLIKYNDLTYLNISHFLRSLSKSDSSKKEALNLVIEDVYLRNFELKLDDKRKTAFDSSRFDPGHFDFLFDELKFNNITLTGNELIGEIQNLTGIENRSKLMITKMHSDVLFNDNNLVFSDLKIITPNSVFGDSVALQFTTLNNLSYLSDSVEFVAKARNSYIGINDLKKFITTGQFNLPFYFEADVNGTLNNLEISNIDVKSENGSFFSGRVFVSGLTNPKNLFLDFDVFNSKLKNADLIPYLPIPKSINNLSVAGNLLGFTNNFVINGKINSSVGTLKAYLDINMPKNINESTYEGSLFLENFDTRWLSLGGITDDNIRITSKVKGSGLSLNNTNLIFDIKVEDIEILGNSIDQGTFEGTYSKGNFNSKIEIIDQKGMIAGEGGFEYNNGLENMWLEAYADSFSLEDFNIVNQPLAITSKISMQLDELDYKEFNGYLNFESLKIDNGYDVSLMLSSIKFLGKFDEEQLYTIEAPGIIANLKGDFYINELWNDLSSTFHEYSDLALGKEASLIDYYEKKNEIKQRNYSASLDIKGVDLNTYFQLFKLPIYISGDAFLESTYKLRNDAYFSFLAAADSVVVGNKVFNGNRIDINASKDNLSREVLALFSIESKKQLMEFTSETEDLSIEAIWSNEKIDLNLAIRQPSNKNDLKISSTIDLTGDTIELKVNNSNLLVYDHEWKINPQNEIFWSDNKLYLRDLNFIDNAGFISVNGIISDSLDTHIFFEVNNFDLDNFSAIIPKKIGGEVNASGVFTKRTKIDKDIFFSELVITNLSIENYLISDIVGGTEWDENLLAFSLNLEILRNSTRVGTLKGLIKPWDPINQLDLSTTIDNMNIDWLEPLFNETISGVTGLASGKIDFEGSMKNPQINGQAQLFDGKVTINYLNTTYQIDGKAIFDQNIIKLEDVQLTDRIGKKAYVVGTVTHKNFGGSDTNIKVDFTDFELLNTSRLDNTLYYGDVYGSGDIIISGPLSNIFIKVSGTSTPNTRVFLPISNNANVAQEDFITFIDLKNPVVGEEIISTNNTKIVKGVTLDMDINLTRDAYLEMIFDPKTGDIIRGRGVGNLQLRASTNGDFDLFGEIKVEEGAYNWTTSLINKEFKIVPGGTLTFYGDPLQGIMNLNATYRQMADPNDWYGYSQDQSQFSQKSPVLVILGLNGPILNPEITFRLDLDENTTTNIDNRWRDLIASVNSNEEQLKMQVFSLLLFRKFSRQSNQTERSLQGDLGKGLGNSMSEFMSNQLSYWISQVDDNLEVSIDLTGLDQQAFESFRLRLAYTFLGGRLKVERENAGTITNNTDQGGVTAKEILLEGWSVDYILTEDGRLRVKLFSQSNQFKGQSTNITEAGVSLQYIQSFNEFSELLRISRDNALKEKNRDSTNVNISPGILK